MEYKHPVNGHIERAGEGTAIGFLFLGPLYLLFRGAVAAAAGWFLLLLTLGLLLGVFAWPLLILLWIVGVVMAPQHVKAHLLRQGYSQVAPRARAPGPLVGAGSAGWMGAPPTKMKPRDWIAPISIIAGTMGASVLAVQALQGELSWPPAAQRTVDAPACQQAAARVALEAMAASDRDPVEVLKTDVEYIELAADERWWLDADPVLKDLVIAVADCAVAGADRSARLLMVKDRETGLDLRGYTGEQLAELREARAEQLRNVAPLF